MEKKEEWQFCIKVKDIYIFCCVQCNRLYMRMMGTAFQEHTNGTNLHAKLICDETKEYKVMCLYKSLHSCTFYFE